MNTLKKDDAHRLVPSHRVRLAQERARVGAPGSAPHEPQIVLIRDGDTVHAIEVVCTCGKTIRMNCEF